MVNIDILYKQDLVKEVSKKADFTQKDTTVFLNALYDVLNEQLLQGKIINLESVGKLTPFIVQARERVDLGAKNEDGTLKRDKNGKLVTKTVPARLKVKFVPSGSFKETLKTIEVE